MINIFALPPWEVRGMVWAYWPLLLKACSRGCDVHPASFVSDAERREAVIWLACDEYMPLGICVTKKQDRAIYVAVVGGSRFKEWIAALRKRIHEFKDEEKADFLLWRGRKGWARALKLTPKGQDELGYWIFEDYGP